MLNTKTVRGMRLLTITPAALIQLFQSQPVRFEGMPEDARVVRSYYDGHANLFRIVVSSDSFAVSAPGKPLESIEVKVHVLPQEAAVPSATPESAEVAK